jgi:hypothetical protein
MKGAPSLKVSEYLDNYNSLSEPVIEDLETAIQSENLTSDNTSLYREVLMKQYRDLKYDIVEENINGDNAEVKVKVTVYDLYNSKVESENYMNEHQDEFLTEESIFDEVAYMKYRLQQMFEVKDTITHDVTFNLTKVDNEWKINDIDRVTLEKIHGLYNYN